MASKPWVKSKKEEATIKSGPGAATRFVKVPRELYKGRAVLIIDQSQRYLFVTARTKGAGRRPAFEFYKSIGFDLDFADVMRLDFLFIKQSQIQF